MEFTSISEAARFGMNFERGRLEAASHSLALANVAYSSAGEAQSAADTISANIFSTALENSNIEMPQLNMGVKTVLDPKHPLADSTGNIYFADVDPIREMATLVSAIRSYEANIRAYNTNSEMNTAARSIGSQ